MLLRDMSSFYSRQIPSSLLRTLWMLSHPAVPSLLFAMPSSITLLLWRAFIIISKLSGPKSFPFKLSDNKLLLCSSPLTTLRKPSGPKEFPSTFKMVKISFVLINFLSAFDPFRPILFLFSPSGEEISILVTDLCLDIVSKNMDVPSVPISLELMLI